MARCEGGIRCDVSRINALLARVERSESPVVAAAFCAVYEVLRSAGRAIEFEHVACRGVHTLVVHPSRDLRQAVDRLLGVAG